MRMTMIVGMNRDDGRFHAPGRHSLRAGLPQGVVDNGADGRITPSTARSTTEAAVNCARRPRRCLAMN